MEKLKLFLNSPGLFSSFLPRLPHSRTLEIRMRICFWHRDLLLLGQGLRLLEIWRFAWWSFTSLRCRISELARAAILLCPAHPRGTEGVTEPPSRPTTQDDGQRWATKHSQENINKIKVSWGWSLLWMLKFSGGLLVSCFRSRSVMPVSDHECDSELLSESCCCWKS